MENLGTQLELDFGILTAKQQEKVDYFESTADRDSIKRAVENKRIYELLISGCFQEGIDFVNNFKREKTTTTKSLGYGEDNFETEVTFNKTSGGCSLIGDYFNTQKNEMVIKLYPVTYNYGDKLECSYITPQYRAYKPSSLLTKLKKYNEVQKYEFERANKTKLILDYTVGKYKNLFPNAEVTTGTDYHRGGNYTSFPIVKVEFKSGSYLSFRIGYENDNEYLHNKVDAVVKSMNTMEILNMFNKQK